MSRISESAPRPILTAIVAVVISGGLGLAIARSARDVRVDDGLAARAAAAGITLLESPVAMPAFSATDLEGRPLRSADWAGKVVVVNFWATWCTPCKAEVPDFVAMQDRYRDHVQFIGLAVGDELIADVEAFAVEYGINYPVAAVGPELEREFGGILGLPTSFVVDRQGRVVQTHIGWVSPSLYEQEIRLLAGLPLDGDDRLFQN